MALFPLNGGMQFPEGTVVSVYPRTAWPTESLAGAPSGSAVTTGTITNGVANLNVADNAEYVAYANVGGQDRFRRFSTYVQPSAGSRRGAEQTRTADWPGLRPFHAALADRDNSPCDILVVGDSVAEGGVASSTATRWAQRMLNLLRGRFPVAGVVGGDGYVPSWYAITTPAGQGFALSGGTSTQNTNNGLGRRQLVLTQAATTLTLTRTFTSFDLVFTRGTGTSVDVAIDGGAPTTVSTTGAATNGATWRSATVAAGSHTITITNGVGSPAIEGVMLYNGDETKGIRLWEGGHSGYTAALFNAAPTNWAVTISAPILPDLILVELGLNDYKQTTAALFKSDLQALVTLMRSKMTHPEACSIVLLVPYERADAALGARPDPWSAYQQAVWDAAAADATLTVVDLSTRLIATNISDFLGLYSGDQLHPTTKGHAVIADTLASALAPR